MARRVFYSFHYQLDSWRVQTVKQIGAVEGQPLLTSNEWEAVKKNGDTAISNWINSNMQGKSCVIVLIGHQTAGRKWIEYEIKKAWSDGKGLMGIHIYKLLNQYGQPSTKGKNPFSEFTLGEKQVPFDRVVPVYDPAGATSKDAYSTISKNIEAWTENAIANRRNW